MQNDEATLEKRFHWVRGEIKSLRNKIHRVGWFFHEYSLNDLYDMRDRIDSTVQKIGSDVMNWHEQGEFAKKSMDTYNRYRKEVEAECDKVEKEFKNRPPTRFEEFWESMKEGFWNFTRNIMDKLPEFIEGFIVWMGKKLLERSNGRQITGPRR